MSNPIKREVTIGNCRLLLATAYGGDERVLRASLPANYPGGCRSCRRSRGERSRFGTMTAAGVSPLALCVRAVVVANRVPSRSASHSHLRRGIFHLDRGDVRGLFSIQPLVGGSRSFGQGRVSTNEIASRARRRNRTNIAIDGPAACRSRDRHTPSPTVARNAGRLGQEPTEFDYSSRCM